MLQISLFESELQVIRLLTAESIDIETGGELIGLWSHGGAPTVMLATGPAVTAHTEPAHFRQDPQIHMAIERIAWEKFGLQVLGIWHSHHTMGLHELSPGDRKRTRTYSHNASRQYYTEILTFITLKSRDISVCLKPHIYSDASLMVEIPCTFRVLDGTSPVREALLRTALATPVIEAVFPKPYLKETAPALNGNPRVVLLENSLRHGPRAGSRREAAALQDEDDTGLSEADGRSQPATQALPVGLAGADPADEKRLSSEGAVLQALAKAVASADRHVADTVAIDSSADFITVRWLRDGRTAELVISTAQPRTVVFGEQGVQGEKYLIPDEKGSDLADGYLVFFRMTFRRRGRRR